jgi:SAM-dependent methyltransferase
MHKPTVDELTELVVLKYGEILFKSWGPRRRLRFGYFAPDDWYEALLRRLVTPTTRWLDVGGGASMFPHNPPLAQELATRCLRLVGVDPSSNIETNPYLHDRVCCAIEDFVTDEKFDLVTMRMVAEHIADPPAVVSRLRQLLELDGILVIFTVYRWSPLTLISSLLPYRWHFPLKRWFWWGEEKDTFPVAYRMNTRRQLRHWLQPAGFDEILFLYLDDLATFSQFRVLNYLELWLWRCCRAIGCRYPEVCLLGVYRRHDGSFAGNQTSGCTHGLR